jgi:hypothetical protein
MRRSAPGILIFDQTGVLLFSNSEAWNWLQLIPPLRRRPGPLCGRVKASSDASPEGEVVNLSALGGGGPAPQCALRAFIVGEAEGKAQRHIIVLIEKVVGKRKCRS